MNVRGLNTREENFMSKLGLDVKDQIDRNNKTIQESLTPNFFTLNNTVAQLLKENERLQKQCPHEFSDGYCDYCYKSEEDN